MNTNKLSIISLGLASLAMLSGFILVSSNTLANDTAEASIDVPTACLISGKQGK